MKCRHFFINIAIVAGILVSVAFPSQRVQGGTEGNWTSIGDGIEFQEFVLPGPVHAFVARMDRTNPATAIESGIAQGMLAHGRETVSSMASRYDEALNNWGNNGDGTWGSRNRVVVAINGSYFDPKTGDPQFGVIQSGWYAKQYDNYEGWSGFVWTLDRDAKIGQCVANPPSKQTVTFLETGNQQLIDGVNNSREADQLILYTPQFGATTETDGSGVEVLVEMRRPTLIIPSPGSSVTGVIQEVRNKAGSTQIPFDSVVLSAVGTAAEALLQNAHVGQSLRVNQEVLNFEDAECQTQIEDVWTKGYAGVGGAYNILRDGQIRSMNYDAGASGVNPRTAIAYNADYVFFVVVDGRELGYSVGFTYDQLAKFLRDSLEATDGIAQDGGGSSTMVINGQVVNRPSDACTSYKIFLPEIDESGAAGVPVPSNETPRVSIAPSDTIVCERAVANTMMMVNVEPAVLSSSYSALEPVVISYPAVVRLGPGTNYPVVGYVEPGVRGHIIDDLNQLGGVLAKGSYWWKVDLGDLSGWVSEADLAANYFIPSRGGLEK